MVKGKAIPNPKLAKPTNGPQTPPLLANTAMPPINADVHEKETITKVSAIKKIPVKLFVLAFESTLLVQEEGSVSSKAPKNENAKRRNIAKKNRLGIQCVDNVFSAFAPNAATINIPNAAKIKMIENE